MSGIRSVEFSFISPGPSPGENAGESIRHQRGARIKRTLKERFERAGRETESASPCATFGAADKTGLQSPGREVGLLPENALAFTDFRGLSTGTNSRLLAHLRPSHPVSNATCRRFPYSRLFGQLP
jgi:hypothetical protein